MEKKSVAYMLGFALNHELRDSVPDAPTFKKLAEATHIPYHLVAGAFEKAALGRLGTMLGAAAIPAVGLPMLQGLRRMYYSNMYGPGMMGGPNEGAYGGLDPRGQSELTRMAMRAKMRNSQTFNNMNMINDAYRPQPSQSGGPVPGFGMR